MVADTHCIEDLATLAAQYKPDVVIVDLQLNNGDCPDCISKLLSACPQTKVLAFSNHNNEQICLQTFRSGAVGIINKHHSSELLLKAIYAIHAGQLWFDRHVTKLLWQAQFAPNSSPNSQSQLLDYSKLSDSERHIASLACKGLSAKAIGAQLFIAEKTVRNQLSIIYKKIGVKKQIELCLKAPLYDYFKDPHMPRTFYPENQER